MNSIWWRVRESIWLGDDGRILKRIHIGVSSRIFNRTEDRAYGRICFRILNRGHRRSFEEINR
jgi:hypothetical protein